MHFSMIVGRALGAGDDVHLGFEAHARHADGIADAFLPVDDEFLRQHVQDLLVRRDGDGLGRVHHVLHVDVAHFAIADRDHAVRIQAAHVAAGDAGEHRADLAAGHELGFFDGALDRLHRRLDVDHHAFLEAARGLRADADHFDRVVGRALRRPARTTFEVPTSRPMMRFLSGRLAINWPLEVPSELSSSACAASRRAAPPWRQPIAKPFV